MRTGTQALVLQLQMGHLILEVSVDLPRLVASLWKCVWMTMGVCVLPAGSAEFPAVSRPRDSEASLHLCVSPTPCPWDDRCLA